MKLPRRCCIGVNTPHLDSSLRFTSIFVIAIAFCEFSGISQALMDAYSAATTPVVEYARGETAVQHENRSLPRWDTTHPAVSHAKRHVPAGNVSVFRNKREVLSHLYGELDLTMTMEEYFEMKSLPAKPSQGKPQFLLEMHWTDENFRDKVCRIHNACINTDGSLLLHPWMKSKQNHLNSCGIRHLSYMTSDKDFNATDGLAGLDLFGQTPIRYHIPHFLTDVLPFIYASEILRPTFTNKSDIKSVCEAPAGQRCRVDAVRETLYPSLHADKRIAPMPLSAWVPQVAALLPGRPHMTFNSHIFENLSKPKCFRSIIAFNQNSYVLQGRQWFGRENYMFSSHGIDRGSSQRESEMLKLTMPRGCKQSITLLNREGWKRRGGILLGRDVINIGEIVRKLTELTHAKDNENLDLAVRVEYFDNMTFAEQVEVMQSADVILGVHGAGLANMLFARQDVPILEVLPFGYYAGPFQTLAQALGLIYHSTIAEPDEVNFKECLQWRSKKNNDTKSLQTGTSIWNEAVKKRAEGNLYHMLAHKYTQPELVSTKMCARTQRMKLDASATAQKLIDMVQQTCQNKPRRIT